MTEKIISPSIIKCDGCNKKMKDYLVFGCAYGGQTEKPCIYTSERFCSLSCLETSNLIKSTVFIEDDGEEHRGDYMNWTLKMRS